MTNVHRYFQRHSDSAAHIKHIMVDYKIFSKNPNIIADTIKESLSLYFSKYNENVRLNRRVMAIFIDIVVYLGRQELAFRGHDESSTSTNKGNYRELVDVIISNTSAEIRNHY